MPKERLLSKVRPHIAEAVTPSSAGPDDSSQSEDSIDAHPVAVSDNSFQSEVIDASRPVLVDFWAEWCGPCKMIAPILEDVAGEYAEQLKIVKLDVDANPKSAAKFGVQSIPTLILFNNGEPVERLVGYMPKERLLSKVRPHIGEAATA
jgi:thioredoxin 1